MTVKTDDIIRRLGQEAGQPSPPPARLERSLSVSCAVGICLAVAIVLALFGADIDFASVLQSSPFYDKLAAMALLSVGAFALLRHHATPGSRNIALPLLAPVLAIFIAAIVIDWQAYPFWGRNGDSVPICVFAILAASLPPLALLTRAMKSAVVTRPAAAGGAVGFLSGTLGGMAYAVACRNDGALFVITWYGLAIAITTLTGRLLGARYLRW